MADVLAAQLKKQKIKKLQRQPSDIAGNPDIVLRKQKIAIWVNSTFWYGSTKQKFDATDDFWTHQKLRKQQQRREHVQELKAMGWHVQEVWEHDVGKGKIARQITTLIEKNNNSPK